MFLRTYRLVSQFIYARLHPYLQRLQSIIPIYKRKYYHIVPETYEYGMRRSPSVKEHLTNFGEYNYY